MSDMRAMPTAQLLAILRRSAQERLGRDFVASPWHVGAGDDLERGFTLANAATISTAQILETLSSAAATGAGIPSRVLGWAREEAVLNVVAYGEARRIFIVGGAQDAADAAGIFEERAKSVSETLETIGENIGEAAGKAFAGFWGVKPGYALAGLAGLAVLWLGAAVIFWTSAGGQAALVGLGSGAAGAGKGAAAAGPGLAKFLAKAAL